MSKQDHIYRKQDVTGALGFVRARFTDPRVVMPDTDREAARLFFKLDRSNTNMEEFLAQLKAHNVAELGRLTEEARKPPKKVRVGTLNVLTGEVRSRFPSSIELPRKQYDELLALVRWVDDTPACVEIGDHAWESIHDTMVDCVELDDTKWPGVYVDSVQIETAETSQRNITPGTLVVLLMCEDDSDDQEFHCVLTRGA